MAVLFRRRWHIFLLSFEIILLRFEIIDILVNPADQPLYSERDPKD
jgi:hypothetical protein